MNMEKIYSLIIAFFMIFPAAASAMPSSDKLFEACLNSGIIGYYTSVTNAAYKMVNVVVQDFMNMEQGAAKKEAPAKDEENQNSANQAIIPNNAAQKNLKNILSAAVLPALHENAGDARMLNVFNSGNEFSVGWMILLLALMIGAVFRKEGYAAFFNKRLT